MTKYKRALYADKFRHENYDSMEIGQRLGTQLVAEVDPMQPFESSTGDDLLEGTVYQYKNPMIEYCCFPGNRYYVCIRSPGVPIAYEFAKSFENYVSYLQDLITSFCSKYILYFYRALILLLEIKILLMITSEFI